MKKLTIVNKSNGKESNFFFEPKQAVFTRQQIELLKNNLNLQVRENGRFDYSKISAYESNRQLHVRPNVGIDESGYFPTLQVYYY